MKLLMIYCHHFGYQPAVKNLESAEIVLQGAEYEQVQVAFIQVEQEDEESGREKSVENKLLNFTKWIARKNETQKIVLHSFAHLSESKATPEFTKALFDRVENRLKTVGYEVSQTPFGYFLDLKVEAPGFSLARVFKNFD
jgi:hypothetical protein